jgi:hypothetical protein
MDKVSYVTKNEEQVSERFYELAKNKNTVNNQGQVLIILKTAWEMTACIRCAIAALLGSFTQRL